MKRRALAIGPVENAADFVLVLVPKNPRHIGVESEKAKSSRHRAKAHCCSALLWVTASSLLAPLALAPLRQELQAPPLVLHPPEGKADNLESSCPMNTAVEKSVKVPSASSSPATKS